MFAEPRAGFRQATARAQRTKLEWAEAGPQALATREEEERGGGGGLQPVGPLAAPSNAARTLNGLNYGQPDLRSGSTEGSSAYSSSSPSIGRGRVRPMRGRGEREARRKAFRRDKTKLGDSPGTRALEGGLGLNARRQMGQHSPPKRPKWAGPTPKLGEKNGKPPTNLLTQNELSWKPHVVQGHSASPPYFA
jgi:hypothetical protein